MARIRKASTPKEKDSQTVDVHMEGGRDRGGEEASAHRQQQGPGASSGAWEAQTTANETLADATKPRESERASPPRLPSICTSRIPSTSPTLFAHECVAPVHSSTGFTPLECRPMAGNPDRS